MFWQNYEEINNISTISELSDTVFQEDSFWNRVFNSETDPHQDEYNNLCEG